MEPLRLKPILRAAVIGGLWGAALMPLIVVTYAAMFLPQAFPGGWGPYLLYCPVPVGALVGLTIGIARAFRGQGYRRASGWLYTSVGGMLSFLSLRDAVAALQTGGADVPTWGYLASPVFGWPFLWGMVFLAFGAATLRRRRARRHADF